MYARIIPAPAVATPPFHVALRLLLQRGFGLDHPVVLLAVCERLWACAATQWSPQTPWRALQPSRHAGGRSRSRRLRSPKTKAPKSIPRRTKPQQVRSGGAQNNFRSRGQGTVKGRCASMKSCPVLLTASSRQQNRTQLWLRESDRMSGVRASVRGHGAQASARTGRQRGALHHAVNCTVRRAALASSTRGRAYA